MRRVIVMAVGVVLTGLAMSMAQAEDRRERGDKVLTGVLSGLLGESPQPADAAYAAQERERLVSLLQGGGYATGDEVGVPGIRVRMGRCGKDVFGWHGVDSADAPPSRFAHHHIVDAQPPAQLRDDAHIAPHAGPRTR